MTKSIIIFFAVMFAVKNFGNQISNSKNIVEDVTSIDRPNILLITAEHIRVDNIAENGSAWMQTPNLDRLAREGANFTGAYIVGVACAPNRASLFTGRYPQHHGVRGNGIRLPESETTLTHVLKKEGYYTGQFGKLHFLPHANRNHRGQHPSYGFDEMQISDTNGLYDDDYARWVRLKNPKQAQDILNVTPPQQRSLININVFPGDETLTHSAFVGDKTIGFIKRNVDRTWFAHAGFHAAHTSWLNPPTSQLERYENVDLPKRAIIPKEKINNLPDNYINSIENASHTEEEWMEFRKFFYARVSEFDVQLGRIIEALEKTGQLENTIIIFTTDHGEYAGDHGLIGKSDLVYDSVFNIPLIYRGPGINNSANSELVSIVDIMPTILELMQIPIPLGVKGKSHRLLLEGEGSGRESVYAESPTMRMIRTETTKYAIHPEGEILFDMINDPNEFNNLASDASYKELLEYMRSHMRAKNFKLWDDLPEREASF